MYFLLQVMWNLMEKSAFRQILGKVSFQLLLCVREILKSNELNTFMLCDICWIIYQTKVSLILLWNSEIHFYECHNLLYARDCKLYLHIVKLRRILSFTLVRGNKDDLQKHYEYLLYKYKKNIYSEFVVLWLLNKEARDKHWFSVYKQYNIYMWVCMWQSHWQRTGFTRTCLVAHLSNTVI